MAITAATIDRNTGKVVKEVHASNGRAAQTFVEPVKKKTVTPKSVAFTEYKIEDTQVEVEIKTRK